MPNLIGCNSPEPACLSCYKTTVEGVAGNLIVGNPFALVIFPGSPSEFDTHIVVFTNGIGFYSYIGGVWNLRTFHLVENLQVDWVTNLINKPICFTPCEHTHLPSEIIGYTNTISTLQNDLIQLVQLYVELENGDNLNTIKGESLVGNTDIPIGELLFSTPSVTTVSAGSGGYTTIGSYILPSEGGYMVIATVASDGVSVLPVNVALNLGGVTKEGPIEIIPAATPARVQSASHTFFVRVGTGDSLNMAVIATEAPTVTSFKVVKL